MDEAMMAVAAELDTLPALTDDAVRLVKGAVRHSEEYPQKPAGIASTARQMCEARLICDNDAEFMNSSMFESDVHWALSRAGVRGVLRSTRLRITAGYWVQRYGTVPAYYEGVSPWYDSHYDPADPRQVAHRPHKGTTTGRMSSSVPEFQSFPKAKPMSNPSPIKIETRVFIDGVQASGFTVDQLHQKVREQEQVIAELNKIERKSKKLAAEIEQRYTSIDALNAYIDDLPE